MTKRNLTKKSLKNKILRKFSVKKKMWLSVFRSQFGACLSKIGGGGGSRPAGLGGDTHHAEGRVDPDDLAKKNRNRFWMPQSV
jgi:hypothetical protein